MYIELDVTQMSKEELKEVREEARKLIFDIDLQLSLLYKSESHYSSDK